MTYLVYSLHSALDHLLYPSEMRVLLISMHRRCVLLYRLLVLLTVLAAQVEAVKSEHLVPLLVARMDNKWIDLFAPCF